MIISSLSELGQGGAKGQLIETSKVLIEKCENGRLVLSVIVIMRDESRTIKQCIESLVWSCKSFLNEMQFELIIVDSDSSDNSVEIAQSVLRSLVNVDHKIVRIRSSRLTAALGREVGKAIARGRFILFVDGDMFIFKDFIKEGIEYLKNNAGRRIVGLVGKRIDVIPKGDKYLVSIFTREVERDGTTIAPGGGLLVNSDYLPNPTYLVEQKNSEEKSLAIRLLGQGYRIIVIDKNMYVHFNYKADTRTSKQKFVQSSLSLGESVALLWKELRQQYNLKQALKLMPKEVNRLIILFLVCLIVVLTSAFSLPVISIFISFIYLGITKFRFGMPVAFFWTLAANAKKTEFEIEVIVDVKK